MDCEKERVIVPGPASEPLDQGFLVSTHRLPIPSIVKLQFFSPNKFLAAWKDYFRFSLHENCNPGVNTFSDAYYLIGQAVLPQADAVRNV